LGKSDLLYTYLNFNKTIFKIWNTNLSGGYGFIKINTGSASISNDKPTWGYLIQSNNTLQFSKGWNSEIYLSYAGPTVLGIYKIAALFNSGLGISKSVFKNKGSVKFSFTDVFNTQIQKSEINYIGVTMSESKKTESQFIQLSFNLKLGNMNI
jgi:iron complex outermembrane receptor protein